MNFFEQQLRRLAAACGEVQNPVFAGRACFGDLGAENRVKLQFITLGHADHYPAVKASILNRAEGEVDSLVFRFSDVWGKKMDSNYNGGVPHIWTSSGKSEWYGYQPTNQDFKILAAELGGYLDVFTLRAPVRDKEKPAEKESVVKKLRDAKQTGMSKKPPAPKKHEPEL